MACLSVRPPTNAQSTRLAANSLGLLHAAKVKFSTHLRPFQIYRFVLLLMRGQGIG